MMRIVMEIQIHYDKLLGVLFDMDGVLCDSEEFICAAAQRMFAEMHNCREVLLGLSSLIQWQTANKSAELAKKFMPLVNTFKTATTDQVMNGKIFG